MTSAVLYAIFSDCGLLQALRLGIVTLTLLQRFVQLNQKRKINSVPLIIWIQIFSSGTPSSQIIH